MKRPLAVGAAAVALLVLAAPAHAHLVTTGLGPLYDGVSHVLMSPDDLLPVLAMAFLAGLNGKAAGRHVLFALPLAWIVGALAGFALRAPVRPDAAAAVPLLVLGALTAVDRRLSPTLVTGLALVLGLLHGWPNGAGIAVAGREAISIAGLAAAIFVLVALVAAFVASLRAPWARIMVRVLGSWIAAIGLLMLGWSIRVGA